MPPSTRRSSPWRQLLVLAGLTGFAISQPVLSVLGDEPATLVHYGIEGPTLAVFAALVAFGPPLILWAIARGIAWVSPRAGQAVYLVILGALMTAFAIQVAKDIGLSRSAVLAVVSLAVAVGFVVAYVRFPVVALWASCTAILPLLAVGYFTLASPAAALRETRSAPPERVAGSGDLPSVVVIVLDELPTRSLLDEVGGIDRVRFPNLAGLGDEATWYRHHTSLASYTSVAVPSLLTGQVPEVQDALYTNYPDNLFTLLAPTHELEVLETATRLCPYSTCEPTIGGSTEAATSDVEPGLRDLLGVTADLWRERVSLDPTRPATLDDFEEPVDTGELASGVNGDASGLVSDDRRLAEPDAQLRLNSTRVDAFISSFDAAKGPSLYYLHLMLPHQPWLRWADGQAYDVDDPLGLGLPAEDHPYLYSWNPWTAAVTEQRHLLQAQDADRQVGDMLDALRASDLYDDSLIVVTSDHGVSLEERTEPRLVERATLDAIAYAPLLMKLPGQHDAVVNDSNVMAIDLVPTIADRLGIPLPWKADGVPAGSDTIAARGDTKVMYDLEGVYQLDLAEILRFSDRATFATVGDRSIGPITAEEDDLAGLDRRLGLDGVLGRRLDDLDPTPSGRVQIGAVDRLRRPPEGDPELAVVTGRVQDAPGDARFVLAVNGVVVAGSELSEDSSGRDGVFTVLLPQGVLASHNEIRAAVVTADGTFELEVTD